MSVLEADFGGLPTGRFTTPAVAFLFEPGFGVGLAITYARGERVLCSRSNFERLGPVTQQPRLGLQRS